MTYVVEILSFLDSESSDLCIEIVFIGPYSTWKYTVEATEDAHYCQYVPFMFAFIVLILNWILAMLHFVMGLLTDCLEFLLKFDNKKGGVDNEKALELTNSTVP